MKKLLSLSLTLLLLQSAFCFVLSPISVSAQTQETLTNQKIVEMVKSGLSNEIVVAKIKSSNSSFDTSATALKGLKKAGVSDAVILVMVQKASGIEMATGNVDSNTNIASNNSLTSVMIPDGTEIKIITNEEISSKKVVEGDPLTFKVEEDVKINGKTVIAEGSIVKGTVTDAKKSGRMGKSGNLSIRIESAQTVDGQKIKLRASKSGEGGDNTGSTIALTVLFGPLGLLRKGKEAKIKAGTILTAYTDEAKTVMAKD
jgi:hypothetical protein